MSRPLVMAAVAAATLALAACGTTIEQKAASGAVAIRRIMPDMESTPRYRKNISGR